MRYVIKRNINLFWNDNIIKFGFNVKISANRMGFENFDIDNKEISIDNLLEKLDTETIIQLSRKNPIYISLSDYFFENIIDLCDIEYETSKSLSKVTRQDFINLKNK